MAARGLGSSGREDLVPPSRPAEERQFSALFSQSLGAVAFNTVGLMAGFIFASFFELFSRRSWSIAAYPCVLTTRGMVGGVFCGRLTSGLWLGTIEPRFRANTPEFKTLYCSMMVLSSLAALMMACSISLYGLSWGITGQDVLDLVAAVVATMALAFTTAPPISALVAFRSFERGLDPDVVTYPVSSASSDVIVTCCYTATLALMYHGPLGRATVYAICLAFLAACALTAMRKLGEEGFRRTLREALASSALVVVISGLTGTLLSEMNITIGLGPEICTAYPALIGTVGDVGSIVGSTATTKLWSGEMEARMGSLGEHRKEVAAAWAASALMFSAYAFFSALTGSLASLPSLLATFLLANLMA
ncbi:hypothetical protein DRO33_04650, partial [Candidatus Bathyarchaeota archaeon]